MKKQFARGLAFLMIACLLSACGASPAGTSPEAPATQAETPSAADTTAPETASAEESTAAPETAPREKDGYAYAETKNDGSGLPVAPPDENTWVWVELMGVEMLWNGRRVQEPDTVLDIDNMSCADFGDDLFTGEWPVEVETYTLCKDEIMETEVVHIKGAEEGKTVYVVAGVHGDERAAWYAGRLLRNISIKAGELYVLAPANAAGAKALSRYVKGAQDMNRSFPGDPEGTEAERIANAIYTDIERVKPFMVFDLHEAIIYTAERDFLGSTLIFSILDGIEDMFFDMLFATEAGTLASNKFGYSGPGPVGSINFTVADKLKIPAITVETYRGFPVERRVHDQLDIVQYALRDMGLID